jgi:hypothetical protein
VAWIVDLVIGVITEVVLPAAITTITVVPSLPLLPSEPRPPKRSAASGPLFFLGKLYSLAPCSYLSAQVN